MALSKQADVTLLLYGSVLRDVGIAAGLSQLIEVPGTVVMPQQSPLRRRARNVKDAIFSRYPPEVTAYRPIRANLRSGWERLASYDAVQIEHPGLAPLVGMKRNEAWFLTLHNIGSGTLNQQANLSSGRQRWMYRRQAAQARHFERIALKKFDHVFSVSEEDARLLPFRTEIVPNGVDLKRFNVTTLPDTPSLAFIGTLGYLPNADGAEWFARTVLPLVRLSIPDAALKLVGRAPTDKVKALAALPGVSLVADVPDSREYFLEARVCIVPLRVGTGTRLKALEAFAARRPVVGTSVGLSGLGVVHGVHALVADKAEALAACVVEVIRSDELAANLVREARTLVERDFDWLRIGQQFADALTAATVNRPPQ